jgi:hypothetical protein
MPRPTAGPLLLHRARPWLLPNLQWGESRDVLNQLRQLRVWSVPTTTSLEALTGSALEYFELDSHAITDFAPLATLHALKSMTLRRLSAVNLAPLATLPQLRNFFLMYKKNFQN